MTLKIQNDPNCLKSSSTKKPSITTSWLKIMKNTNKKFHKAKEKGQMNKRKNTHKNTS